LATELALHFEGGRDYEQAIRYLILAAENAAGRCAYRDSIEILDHALELVAKLSTALQADRQVRIFEFIGYAHFALGALPESAEAYAAAASRAEQAGLRAAQVHALISAMYPLGFINPERGLAALDQAVQMSVSAGDPVLLARTQMVATSCHLIFDDWREENAELCVSAYETLRRLGDSGLGPYHQMIYAHVLTLRGSYREALELIEAAISRTDYGISLIPHFGALSAKTLTLLRLGQLGEVLRITRAGRESADENIARSWLLTFREAWLRTLVFDYEGAHRISEAIAQTRGQYHPGQPHTISQIAAGYIALDRREYRQAIEYFTQIHHPEVTTKFFLHWIWRMTAQLELGNAWLLCGDIPNARTAADGFLESARSTADPHMHALAWDLRARVAMAENDWAGAREHIQQALAIVDKFEILVAAWQTYATAWQLYQLVKEQKTAETNRERAECCILKIANSFAPDEPLRATFLAAAPVRRTLREIVVTNGSIGQDAAPHLEQIPRARAGRSSGIK